MATYAWTGPNSFTSNIQSPTRPNATPAMAGTYTLVATTTGSGCSGSSRKRNSGLLEESRMRFGRATGATVSFSQGDPEVIQG